MILVVTLMLIAVCATSDQKTLSSHQQQQQQQQQPYGRQHSQRHTSFIAPSSSSSFRLTNSSSPRRAVHHFPDRGSQFRKAFETSLTQMFGLTSRPVLLGGGRRRHRSLSERVPQFMTKLYEQIVAESNENNYDGSFPAEVLPGDHVTNARGRGQFERQRHMKSSGYELYGRHKRHDRNSVPTTVNTVRSFIGKASLL